MLTKAVLDITFLFYPFDAATLTEQVVTLKNVFTRDLQTKITSSVYSLFLYDHSTTVGLPLQKPG